MRKGRFQLMLILGLLGMYFDAAVVFVTKSLLFFRLAVAILWGVCSHLRGRHKIIKKIWSYKMCKTHHCALWLRYQQIHTTTNLLLLYPEWDCSEFSSIKEKFDSIWYLKESIRKLLSQNAHFCIFYWSHSSGK